MTPGAPWRTGSAFEEPRTSTRPRLCRPPRRPSTRTQGFEIGAHVSTQCQDYTGLAGLRLLRRNFRNSLQGTPGCLTRPPTGPTASLERLVHPSRSGTEPTGSGWTRTTTTGRPTGPRIVPASSPAPACPCGSPITDGSMIDVYQAASQMTDESGQTYPFTIDTLLDKALGAEGYYGAFTINAHTDVPDIAESSTTVASAKARGVPMCHRQADARLGRREERFGLRGLAWNGRPSVFTVAPGAAHQASTCSSRHIPPVVRPQLREPGWQPRSTSRPGRQGRDVRAGAWLGPRLLRGHLRSRHDAPTLTSTTPSDGATDIVGRRVTATFSESVGPGHGDLQHLLADWSGWQPDRRRR